MRIVRIIIVFIALFTLTFGISYLLCQVSSIQPINYSPVSDLTGCQIEDGLEDIATTVKPAIENYLNQDTDESKNNRINRLSYYFTGNSPVYEYELNNLNDFVKKSVAKIVSMNSYKTESESTDLYIIVQAELTLYSSDKETTNTRDYLVTLDKTNNGQMIPYDIGELN